MRLARSTAVMAAATLVASGLAVAGAAATTTVGTAPLRTIAGASTGLETPYDVAVDPAGRIVVANETAGDDSILVFAADANGDVTPVRTITGPTVKFPEGVDVDAQGLVYAENGLGVITVYGPDAASDAVPLRTITIVDDTSSVAVGPDGTVYVGSWSGGHVRVYAPGAADPSPGVLAETVRDITGDSTGLQSVEDLVVGPGGDLYALSTGSRSVRVFGPDADGDVAPKWSVTAPVGANLRGLEVDSSGNVYVTDVDNDVVHVFAAGLRGEVEPTVSLTGVATGLDDPWGLALDADRNLVVANEQAGTVTVHAPLMPFLKPSAAASVKVSGKPKAKKRTVSWSAAADDGGAPVSYAVRVSRGKKTLLSTTTTKTSLKVTRKHLRSGKHTVSVTATNRAGAAAAASAKFKVAKIKPAKVREVDVRGKDKAGKCKVTWKKPAWTGGAKLKAYRVAVKKGERTLVREVVRAKKRSLTVAKSELASGKHQVRVQARNKKGWGKAGKETFRVER